MPHRPSNLPPPLPHIRPYSSVSLCHVLILLLAMKSFSVKHRQPTRGSWAHSEQNGEQRRGAAACHKADIEERRAGWGRTWAACARLSPSERPCRAAAGAARRAAPAAAPAWRACAPRQPPQSGPAEARPATEQHRCQILDGPAQGDAGVMQGHGVGSATHSASAAGHDHAYAAAAPFAALPGIQATTRLYAQHVAPHAKHLHGAAL